MSWRGPVPSSRYALTREIEDAPDTIFLDHEVIPENGRRSLECPRIADGLGEDISAYREERTARHETRAALQLEGEWTLPGFCEHLAALELWPEPSECDGAWRFRHWAF